MFAPNCKAPSLDLAIRPLRFANTVKFWHNRDIMPFFINPRSS